MHKVEVQNQIINNQRMDSKNNTDEERENKLQLISKWKEQGVLS